MHLSSTGLLFLLFAAAMTLFIDFDESNAQSQPQPILAQAQSIQ